LARALELRTLELRALELELRPQDALQEQAPRDASLVETGPS